MILHNEQTKEQHESLARHDSFNKNLLTCTIVLHKTYSVAADDVDLPLPLLLLYFTIGNPVLRLSTGLNKKSETLQYIDCIKFLIYFFNLLYYSIIILFSSTSHHAIIFHKLSIQLN